MAWVSLDDQFPQHPHVIGLSDAAFRLHTSGICYCSRHSTDGLIDIGAVPTLVPRYSKRTLAELLGHSPPLWLPRDGYYEIRDYLQWNPSRAEIQAMREARSKSGKLGAQRRWGRKR